MRTITVKGTGNASARPDYIILSLNIEVLSESYDRAMSEAAERIERLQGAAVCVGYRKEDLKTTSFDVQTRYENVKDRQGNYKREFVGYACSYRLKLAFDFDSKQLAKVISAIADCGAKPELGIAFTVEPDFHNRSFPLWCADHARHTIAHNFLNSYQNKSGDFCFYFNNKIGGSICIWMIHRQIVVDHHFQKIIKLIVRTHIGVHDACNIGFFSLSTHSVPFSQSQFGQ